MEHRLREEQLRAVAPADLRLGRRDDDQLPAVALPAHYPDQQEGDQLPVTAPASLRLSPAPSLPPV